MRTRLSWRGTIALQWLPRRLSATALGTALTTGWHLECQRRRVGGPSRDRGRMARTRSYSTPGNLPVELSSFVGRGRELLEIRRLLAVAHAVTLTGAGGIGKSRLAPRAADKPGRAFPRGGWVGGAAGRGRPGARSSAA